MSELKRRKSVAKLSAEEKAKASCRMQIKKALSRCNEPLPSIDLNKIHVGEWIEIGERKIQVSYIPGGLPAHHVLFTPYINHITKEAFVLHGLEGKDEKDNVVLFVLLDAGNPGPCNNVRVKIVNFKLQYLYRKAFHTFPERVNDDSSELHKYLSQKRRKSFGCTHPTDGSDDDAEEDDDGGDEISCSSSSQSSASSSCDLDMEE